MSVTSNSLDTLLATAGCEPESDRGAVTPPLHFSTTFERAPDGSFPGGHIYVRDSNPTRNLFERTLARAEGGAACAAFSSGMAASNAVIMAAAAGGHVIIPSDVYHGLRHLLDTSWTGWGLQYTAVDYGENWGSAIRPDTKLIWVETPSNPLVQVTSIRSVADIASAHGIPLVVDSTWNSPLILRPLALGATLVVHSTTKYLGGHSDVLGGAVIAAQEDGLFQLVRQVQKNAGAVMDPFSAWLTLRGMRSLGARMRLQCASAMRLAEFLEAHPRVDKVHYPGLAAHAGHRIAKDEMALFGGMISFEVPGERREAMAVAGRMKVFRRATSLGGTESLVEHRASIEPEPPVSPEGLLRLSVGLELVDDLLEDLSQALEAAP